MDLFKRFVQEEEGLETVEYAIILGIIVVGTIALITSIGGWVNTQFQAVDTALEGAAGP
ncbi:MAG: Flp family type IVb pilin [Phycisphaeraceae bacterium]